MARLKLSDAAGMTAAELVAHLTASGLSQREIARRIGSTSATLSRIAAGERTAGEAIFRDLLALATGRPVQKLPEKSPD